MAQLTPGDPDPRMTVPPVLRDAAAWAWRLIVVGVVVFYGLRILQRLYLPALAFFVALLLTALLRPPMMLLRRRGVPRALATWAVIIVGFAVLIGVGAFVVERASSEYPQLVTQLGDAVHRAQSLLTRAPFRLKASTVTNWQRELTSYLNTHRSTVVSGVVTGVTVVGELLTGIVLCFFCTFFMLYDGERIWGWLVSLFPRRARYDVTEAAGVAWERLGGFIRGTFLIACFHGLVVSVTLLFLGVPLVAPLGLLVFIGSFIPIVGAVIFGGLAVLVAFLTKGVVAAVVMVTVLIIENQIEAHLLQPFLVGRFVRLHPLAVVIAITVGGIYAGLVGAIVALPATAVVYAIAEYYARPRPTVVTTESRDDAVSLLRRP